MLHLDRAHFRLLLALSRLGSVTAAATALGVTQSAASQRLHEAERRVGFPLVERHGRTLVLTPAAERLVDGAAASERACTAAEADAQWIARAAGPRLRVLVSVFDETGWLLALSAHLRALDEPVTLEVIRGTPETAATLLAGGGADIALMPAAGAPGDAAAHRVFEDELVAVAEPGDPMAARETVPADAFVARTYVTYSYVPEQGFEYDAFFSPANVVPDRVQRVESASAILDFVAAGQGVTILSRWLTRTAAAAGRVAVRPLTPAPRMAWVLVTRRLPADDPLPGPVAAAVALLRGEAGADLDPAGPGHAAEGP